jgi:hypothetical protein
LGICALSVPYKMLLAVSRCVIGPIGSQIERLIVRFEVVELVTSEGKDCFGALFDLYVACVSIAEASLFCNLAHAVSATF